MIGVEDLIVKINTLIGSGTLTDDQMIQLSGAVNALENYGVGKVATASDLPNPVTNKGRFLFIESESRYVFSNGVSWDINNLIEISRPRLYSWGSGLFGFLGDGTTVSKSSPVSVVSSFDDWIEISQGAAIRADGTAWTWGRGAYGMLGDGTTVSKTSPVSVIGGFTDWVQISSSPRHRVAIRANGTAWAWGFGQLGRLGDNSTTSKSSPVSVVGGFTDWIQVSAGYSHNLGVRANGTAWAWGVNNYGRLGDGTTTAISSPISVIGGFTDWIQVSAGYAHSLGLRANGNALAWGRGISGRLGDGTLTTRSSPVSVVGGFTDWVQLSAGGSHSLGLRANGTAWGWGDNNGTYAGVLGDGTITTRSSPVSVVGGFTDWVQVSAGIFHSLGLRANGTAWAWGNTSYGQLGDNSATNRSSPVSVVGGFTDWVRVNAGRYTSNGLRG